MDDYDFLTHQQIKALLDIISNKLQHNITLLVYSEDIESSNKLNFFENHI